MDFTTAWLLCVGSALYFVFMTTVGPRFERWRRVMRRTYTNPLFPLMFRGAVGVFPILGLACGVLVVGLLLPRPLAQWFALAWLDLGGLAFLLTYRAPPPFMPQFLRDEIDRGVVPLQRPDWSDWLVFAITILLGFVSNVAAVLIFSGYWT